MLGLRTKKILYAVSIKQINRGFDYLTNTKNLRVKNFAISRIFGLFAKLNTREIVKKSIYNFLTAFGV